MALNSDKWDDWMKKSLDGDKNSYRLLLNELRIWLKSYFAKRIHIDGVEDLVQDTLLAIHNKRQTYDHTRPFGPWLSAVARHKWIDKMRKNIKYIEVEIDDNIQCLNEAVDNCAKHDVKTLLKLIPQNQAKIIEMVKLQEMTIEEVAIKTGISQSSVKVIVHRGLKLLQTKLEVIKDE